MDKILDRFSLTEEQLQKFKIYYEELITVNQTLNLTRITEEKECYVKHFYDSLSLLRFIDLNEETIIDIGAGAGFPSVPLLIARPNLKVTIVEALNKRCLFLLKLKEKLNLTNLTVVHGRAEEYIKENREVFDLGVARAVAKLNILAELVTPYLKVNGFFLPYKTDDELELKEASNCFKTLNLELKETFRYELPEDFGKRVIYQIIKTKKTNPKYPRLFSKIKQQAL